MSSSAKSVLGELLLSDLIMKNTTTAKLLLTYLICMRIHTPGYKIKSLTLHVTNQPWFICHIRS